MLRDILAKPMGCIQKNYGIYGQKLGMYWAKTIGYLMGYIWQNLWDIFEKI